MPFYVVLLCLLIRSDAEFFGVSLHFFPSFLSSHSDGYVVVLWTYALQIFSLRRTTREPGLWTQVLLITRLLIAHFLILGCLFQVIRLKECSCEMELWLSFWGLAKLQSRMCLLHIKCISTRVISFSRCTTLPSLLKRILKRGLDVLKHVISTAPFSLLYGCTCTRQPAYAVASKT